MMKQRTLKTLAFFALAAVCTPMLLGGCPAPVTCPPGQTLVNGVCTPPAGNTTLLSKTVTSNNGTGIVIAQNACYTAPAPAHNNSTQTFNAVAGKVVTCTVTGPVDTSRPRIQVTEIISAAVVAASTTPPTSKTATATFTPSGNQLFIITMEDCTPSAAADYTFLVTQAS